MSAIPRSLLPADEAERLLSLRQHDILHSLHEPVFDEFVALTARIFGLPISLIALIDEETVHYKANHGMPGHHAQPREEALCATAILHHERAVVYQDLSVDENPLLTAQARAAAERNGLRFYAAAPLCMPGQHNIGTLCVIDHQPRAFTDGEQRMLEQLANLVGQTVAARHRCLSRPGGEQQWQRLRAQLAEETQALTALVRYMFARQGVQTPVPAESLSQVGRRLLDLQETLDHYR